MPHDFSIFKTAVARQFERMQRGPNAQLFRVDIAPDDLWAAYLAAFPPGTNLVYRERTEYDCSCCEQFIRTIGNVVGVVDGALVSIWDTWMPEEPAYQAVANALTAKVLTAAIIGPFFHYEWSIGTDRNFEQMMSQDNEPDAAGEMVVKTWLHFHVNLDKQRFVRAKNTIPTAIGERRAAHDVFLRSLQEIDDDAIETVLDLIGQGSLYRGEEHRATVQAFRKAKQEFTALPDDRARDLYAWTADASGAVTRIRNTVIGTLLVDLSEGKDLDASVRAFESKVAPTNYKRPSALVTKAMIEKAKEKIEELGLTSALERRYARITDISIKDLLFADRGTRKTLTGNVFDELSETAPMGKGAAKNLDKIEEIGIERFLTEIVPRAESIEVLFENRHAPNLVSLIAPVDPTARRLFKWPSNNLSWSYAGEVADAIKERVKLAGGNVTGDLCCRLGWYNYDDLDLHMKEPGGHEISFMTRGSMSPSWGRLDVDMNVSATTREAVENIYYGSRGRMREGEYHLFVHQYNARETSDVGFEVQIDYLGALHKFAYTKPVRNKESITVAKFKYTHAAGMVILESLPMTEATRTLWGVQTQTFRRVSAIMLSPNHWDGESEDAHGVGNRHYIFALDGCKNDGGARGFYNEFLAESLTPHRKVFEVVAGKIKPAENPSGEQLSGLGFSSTARNSVVCRVKGSFTRTVRVVF